MEGSIEERLAHWLGQVRAAESDLHFRPWNTYRADGTQWGWERRGQEWDGHQRAALSQPPGRVVHSPAWPSPGLLSAQSDCSVASFSLAPQLQEEMAERGLGTHLPKTARVYSSSKIT